MLRNVATAASAASATASVDGGGSLAASIRSRRRGVSASSMAAPIAASAAAASSWASSAAAAKRAAAAAAASAVCGSSSEGAPVAEDVRRVAAVERNASCAALRRLMRPVRDCFVVGLTLNLVTSSESVSGRPSDISAKRGSRSP